MSARVLSLRAALLCAAAAALLAPPSRALADGPAEGGDADSLKREIQAQAEKIVRLMRENEKALLEASRGSGKKPAGVDVGPIEPGGAREGAAAPAGTGLPQGGDEVRRRLEDLLKASQEKGATIPKELEELVKMIPT